MTDVADLGIRIDSSPATKAVKQLDALTASAARAEDATQDLAMASSRKLAPGMAAGGQQSRLMAMQLSQVAQQASATGNWVQALAIQLPDMAMGFGAVGIAAGVLASVTLPLLASLFEQTAEEMRDAAKAVDEMKAITDSLNAAQQTLDLTLPQLIDKYGRYAFVVRDAAAAIAELQVAEAKAQLAQSIADASEALEVFTGRSAGILSAGESIGQTWARISDEFGVTNEEAQTLYRAFRDLEDAATFEQRTKALAGIDAALRSAGVSAEQLPPEVRAMLLEAQKAQLAMVDLASAAQGAETATSALAGAAPGAGWLAGAISDATTLAGTLWDAAAAAAAAREGQLADQYAAMGDDERGSQRLQGRSAGEFRRGAAIAARGRGGRAGGGGGGGGADQYGSELQSLIESLRTEREIEEEWYEESLAILADRRAQEILSKQAHDEAMIALHEEYQRRIAEIDGSAADRRLGEQADFFGAMAGIAQAGGQRMAKAAAAFGAVEATINAYRAAVQALADPRVGFWGKAAAYASVLATGLKGVAAIRSAGGIGGGGGARIAAQGATSQASGPPIEYRVYGLERDAVYSGEFIEKIFSGLMEEGKRRGMTNQSVVFVG